ncbi:2-phosphosulfolactate phosphatase [Halosimplex aquaticum]|uniref:2-phosphosulfolactate phosphatase n=1 Tax=Halosimplex aquaticum TaxID=3026162 RepID=A0ABD5Y0A2_9EURY|nr:2-phosphosulfolactate phosphatase [Halosimplex aquaticum]
MRSIADPDLDETLTDRILPSRARIPEDPPAGDYVVIDVTHFSTTVVELFENGAEYVHVTEERGDEHAFAEEHPRAKIGGGSSEEYTPTEGYDFFNSPTWVQDVDVAGRPTALTSTNGGAAVTDLRLAGGDDVDVYVGTLANARAVADHLDGAEKPTYLVAAGSKGKPSPEDTVGAVVIGRHVYGESPSDAERDLYRQIAKLGKAPKYAEKADIRLNDLVEYDLRFSESAVVPRLDGQKLYDVSDE